MGEAEPTAELIRNYVRFLLTSDPITATRLGVHDHDGNLPDADAAAARDHEEQLARYLHALENADAGGFDQAQWLDWRCALISARTELRRARDLRPWQRAPYWHAERLGQGLSVLMMREFAPAEVRGEALRSRLDALPRYLASAGAALDHSAPRLHVSMGLTATGGLAGFIGAAVPEFATTLPAALQRDLSRSVARALEAVARFRGVLHALEGAASGSWACGPEHFDFLLRELHLLGLDHAALRDLGHDRVARDSRRLQDYARRLDRDLPWQAQVARIKDRHPAPDQFLEAYGSEMERARQHTLALDLVTVPPGERCVMGWVPGYLRASLPIAVMSTVPPFEADLTSEWLITPSDPGAPEARRREQARDNCYAFTASIAGHETYPGHHLQKVHHRLATGDSVIRRYFSSPLMVEGWGLYTEDLFDETGFFTDPDVVLFRLRNALWRSVRVVVDTGLHTGGMSFQDAVDALRDQAALDTHMAEGEIRRYVRHDDPTYPSAYLLGCEAIHELRAAWRARQSDSYTSRDFHDRFLSYGSIPVGLIAEAMLGDGARVT